MSDVGEGDVDDDFWSLPEGAEWPTQEWPRRCAGMKEAVELNEEVERFLRDVPPVSGWELRELTWQGVWAMLLCIVSRGQGVGIL